MDTSDTVQTRRKTPRRKLSPEAKQLLKGKLPILAQLLTGQSADWCSLSHYDTQSDWCFL